MEHHNRISALMQQISKNIGCSKSCTTRMMTLALAELMCFSNQIFVKKIENNIRCETY